ncbi:MAG TPA: hypothetical protein VH562_06615, partial [Nitrosopumilaceae archaeon]
SPQMTLSGDLANDPVAQDILQKIELTKKWIADLEQKNYQKLQAERMLEEKRAIALERLNADLKEWDALWEEYSSRNSFERFASDKPSAVQEVFWDAFEFKEMKVKAGRDALKQAIANGGTMREAREAYIQAAETKRIELIEANAQFNVKHNLAYYKQQLLFDIQGQFVNSTENIIKLNQYYTDYRADPAYLAANPDDKLSYEALGKTDANTQCREGYVVIHRFHANDYTCVTESTAEMWILHGMGELPLTHVSTSPDAKILSTDTAEQTGQDLDAIAHLINQKFRDLGNEVEEKKLELIKHYDKLYATEKEEAKKAEKEIIVKSYSVSMTEKELSELITAIRDKYNDSMESILAEKIQSLDKLKNELDRQALDIITENNVHRGIEIVWNSDISNYEAIVKTNTE